MCVPFTALIGQNLKNLNHLGVTRGSLSMKRRILSLFALIATCASHSAHSSLISYFKEEDGSTNWQYIANFSSSVLILLLLITTIFLFFSVVRAIRANRALQQITENLEHIVEERTQTLNTSNQLLQAEIGEHKETTSLLSLSEAYIHSILDSMPLMLIGLNKDLQITQWNSWSEETTGLSFANVSGRYLWDAYPTITLSPEQVKDVQRSGESNTIKLSQRGQYYFDITVYPLVDQPETGIVILIQDVTQQCKASNLLIQKDKFSALGELAAAMAHDINVPLAAIETDISSLRSDMEKHPLDTSHVIATLNKSSESSQQASAIIRHLIEFSNTENSSKQPCSIPTLIDHALSIARSMFADTQGLTFNDIQVDRQYAEDLPEIPCYQSELQQVCISIFRHAWYALGKRSTSTKDAQITVDVSDFYDSLWIKIHHNGVGLTEEEQMTIFEPFYQNADVVDGCEMANRLSFAFFIVTEHHGGQMAVTSDLDLGTTFHIQLQHV